MRFIRLMQGQLDEETMRKQDQIMKEVLGEEEWKKRRRNLEQEKIENADNNLEAEENSQDLFSPQQNDKEAMPYWLEMDDDVSSEAKYTDEELASLLSSEEDKVVPPAGDSSVEMEESSLALATPDKSQTLEEIEDPADKQDNSEGSIVASWLPPFGNNENDSEASYEEVDSEINSVDTEFDNSQEASNQLWVSPDDIYGRPIEKLGKMPYDDQESEKEDLNGEANDLADLRREEQERSFPDMFEMKQDSFKDDEVLPVENDDNSEEFEFYDPALNGRESEEAQTDLAVLPVPTEEEKRSEGLFDLENDSFEENDELLSLENKEELDESGFYDPILNGQETEEAQTELGILPVPIEKEDESDDLNEPEDSTFQEDLEEKETEFNAVQPAPVLPIPVEEELPQSRDLPESKPSISSGKPAPAREPIDPELDRPKTHEEIKAKRTNYVFVFGYTGSGKSTVLTAINMYMRQHYRVILNQMENKEGIRLIHNMMRSLEDGKFPQATSVGTITEYDTAYTIDGETVNLTFLEMAGEDLKQVDVDTGDEGLSDHIKAYLTCPGISLSFLIVADYDRVINRREDKLILQFLSYLYSENIDMSRVGVVLSKFDRGLTDLNVQDVISSYLPQVDKWLTSDDIAEPRVFPFSVGKVRSQSEAIGQIDELDLEDCSEIVEWMHHVLLLPEAGPYDVQEEQGWFGKMKGMLGL